MPNGETVTICDTSFRQSYINCIYTHQLQMALTFFGCDRIRGNSGSDAEKCVDNGAVAENTKKTISTRNMWQTTLGTCYRQCLDMYARAFNSAECSTKDMLTKTYWPPVCKLRPVSTSLSETASKLYQCDTEDDTSEGTTDIVVCRPVTNSYISTPTLIEKQLRIFSCLCL